MYTWTPVKQDSEVTLLKAISTFTPQKAEIFQTLSRTRAMCWQNSRSICFIVGVTLHLRTGCFRKDWLYRSDHKCSDANAMVSKLLFFLRSVCHAPLFIASSWDTPCWRPLAYAQMARSLASWDMLHVVPQCYCKNLCNVYIASQLLHSCIEIHLQGQKICIPGSFSKP